MKKIKAVGIIPARINSSRFPEKVIYNILGKPMIWHVYSQSKKSKLIDNIIVATDSLKVVNLCNSYSIPVMMTSTKHKTGTDRLIELSNKIDANIFINIQGDEPLIKGEMIDLLIKHYIDNDFHGVTTLKTRITKDIDISNPHIVKVVTDYNDFAVDFTRVISANLLNNKKINHCKHIGMYAYPKKLLNKISSLSQSEKEKSNNLEQLRLLDNNIPIKVIETYFDTIGVDIPDDIIKVENILKNENILI